MTMRIGKVDRYYEAWSGSLAHLLSQISATEWEVEAADAVPGYDPVATVRFTSEALSGCLWIALAPSDARTLLKAFLSEEVAVATELDDTQKEALLEMLRQWGGLAATALKSQFGELSFTVAFAESSAGDGQQVRFWRARQGANSLIVRVEMDSALDASLAEPEETSFASCPGALTQDRSLTPVDKLLHQGNLDLLMDVELPVMLRFGTRRITLREVLELATGAVLELDREIQQPVDLVLHEKIIARGEVVVVDGNYGLRVTEVASPQQRVSSL